MTEEEHKNLIKLEENLRVANEWIYKGTKADPAIGVGEKLNDKEPVKKKQKEKAPVINESAANIVGMFATSDEQGIV